MPKARPENFVLKLISDEDMHLRYAVDIAFHDGAQAAFVIQDEGRQLVVYRDNPGVEGTLNLPKPLGAAETYHVIKTWLETKAEYRASSAQNAVKGFSILVHPHKYTIPNAKLAVLSIRPRWIKPFVKG